MKELIIKESRWLTGDDIDEKVDKYSCLYRPEDKKMCCLGFLGRACGYKVKEISAHDSPVDLLMCNDKKSKWPKELLGPGGGYDSTLCKKIIDINDSQKLIMSERKKRLIPLFKKIGYKLKFVK